MKVLYRPNRCLSGAFKAGVALSEFVDRVEIVELLAKRLDVRLKGVCPKVHVCMQLIDKGSDLALGACSNMLCVGGHIVHELSDAGPRV